MSGLSILYGRVSHCSRQSAQCCGLVTVSLLVLALGETGVSILRGTLSTTPSDSPLFHTLLGSCARHVKLVQSLLGTQLGALLFNVCEFVQYDDLPCYLLAPCNSSYLWQSNICHKSALRIRPRPWTSEASHMPVEMLMNRGAFDGSFP